MTQRKKKKNKAVTVCEKCVKVIHRRHAGPLWDALLVSVTLWIIPPSEIGTAFSPIFMEMRGPNRGSILEERIFPVVLDVLWCRVSLLSAYGASRDAWIKVCMRGFITALPKKTCYFKMFGLHTQHMLQRLSIQLCNKLSTPAKLIHAQKYSWARLKGSARRRSGDVSAKPLGGQRCVFVG